MNSPNVLPALPFDVQDSVFRTNAWCDAWLATYGKLSQVKTIDLGGAGNSLEMVYLASAMFKKVIPIQEMALVGCGGFIVNSPRSEYNQLNALVAKLGDKEKIIQSLDGLAWNRLHLTDFSHIEHSLLAQFFAASNYHAQHQEDIAYQVSAVSMAEYMDLLGKNTRGRYFNKRNKLETSFSTEWRRLNVDTDLAEFFGLLNGFHLKRWSQPCYSDLSQAFIGQFLQEIQRAGGCVHLSVLQLNDAPQSVLLDVEWRNRRYNLQAGFDESIAGNCKLGSIHLGKAIEEAVLAGVVYDFMAGEGLKSNYKSSIATHRFDLSSVTITRGWMGRLKNWKSN
ncbi:hypothetical protein R50072_05300 [Simiduia litorea]|uniref:GNAT family N-acetyltransferase n=1 Tax=Simiduia litorea TaxID=1435348 RepID=UPI0036F205FE